LIRNRKRARIPTDVDATDAVQFEEEHRGKGKEAQSQRKTKLGVERKIIWD